MASDYSAHCLVLSLQSGLIIEFIGRENNMQKANDYYLTTNLLLLTTV